MCLTSNWNQLIVRMWSVDTAFEWSGSDNYVLYYMRVVSFTTTVDREIFVLKIFRV